MLLLIATQLLGLIIALGLTFNFLQGETKMIDQLPLIARIILMEGSKGGTGKTTFMTSLAEWYKANRVPIQLLDLDVENKNRGSLSHYFPGTPKININTPAGLDSFIDYALNGASIILADMGGGAGQVTSRWFDQMFQQVSEAGIAFTAVAMVTSDPASVESCLHWASMIQTRANFLVVRNSTEFQPNFDYWENTREAKEFVRVFDPKILDMNYRLAELQLATRNHGVTLGDVADRKTAVPELKKGSLVMRAHALRREIFEQLDKIKEILL